MTPQAFDALSWALTRARSRRTTLAALFAVVLPSGAEARQGCKVRDSEEAILDSIAKAARKYGQSKGAMVRVARCESGLDPCAVNRSGPYYGLFQFLKSTWRATPYSDRDIFDPEAQALAAGWMWEQGRKDEWACK
jgi:Transglycosylase SLT domain